jgi:hypothetical protein
VLQGPSVGIVPLAILVQPIVDDPPGNAERASDLSDGLASGDFQQGQGAAVESGILGVFQQVSQPSLLGRGQSQGLLAHTISSEEG